LCREARSRESLFRCGYRAEPHHLRSEGGRGGGDDPCPGAQLVFLDGGAGGEEERGGAVVEGGGVPRGDDAAACDHRAELRQRGERRIGPGALVDRKSTRLNSSHVSISYAVFCLKTKIHLDDAIA